MFENRNGVLKDENNKYDQEWIKLVKEAKNSGLTISDIRNFLQKRESYTAWKVLQNHQTYNISMPTEETKI